MALKLDHRRVATPEDLLVLARRRFLRGERFDIPSLAEELGISRATAYRWAGNAEELTGKVFASLSEDTHRTCVAEARGTGAERILDVVTRGNHYFATSPALRKWADEQDAQTVLRIITSKDGPVQGTLIRLNEALLEEEVRLGNLELTVDAHTMAYMIVRISESFMWSDLITGEQADWDKAAQIHKLLLKA